jgi:SET domain-containing protein
VVVGESKLPGAGCGLFADRDFCKNERITEFCGEVIDADEAKHRRAKGEDTHIRSLVPMYVCVDGRLVSPSDKEQGGGSFVNDSRGKRPYNCKLVVKQVTKGVKRKGLAALERCFVVAITNIKKGEELYASYQRDYWHFVDQAADDSDPLIDPK